jgi:hypothetical protein
MATSRRGTRAFTLVEVVMSVCIMMVVFAGIISCYIQNAYRAEWAGYSLAAQASACQQLERAKCAVWDIQQIPVMDQIQTLKTNPAYSKYVNILDLPISGTNTVYVTNYSYITNVVLSTTPPVSVYYVKVDAVWPFRWGNKVTYYTNTVADYFGPD